MKIMNALGPILAIIVGGYGALAALMYVLQERIVFQPDRLVTRTPADIGLAYEDVELATQDGEHLHGWWIPHPRARTVVVYIHGNAGNVSGRIDTLRTLHGMGVHVLVFDYRGYGNSTGSPSEEGLYLDGQAALAYALSKRSIEEGDVFLFGRSLGSGVATYLAEHHRVGGLVLDAAFTSIPEAGAVHYPYLPVRALSRLQFNNLDRITRCLCPLLSMHSVDDEVIPIEQGRQVFEAASVPKRFIELHGRHNDAFNTSTDDSRPAMRRFVRGVAE